MLYSFSSLRALLLAPPLLACGFARADFNPIPLTPDSYNADVIVENTAPRPFANGTSTSASLDGGLANTGFTWYERGFNTAATATGIPEAGTTFIHESDAAKSYLMPATYAGNNCVFISSQVTTGTITLTTPVALTDLSLLSSSGGGAVSMNYTITFADTTTEAGIITSGDWFNGANPARTTAGRINPESGGYDSVSGTNPRLYSQDIAVVSTSPVTKIEFSYISGGRCSIFAVSGGNTGVWTPLAITGFNHDTVVGVGEVSLDPLTTASTVSMDGGTANTGNTWYERGYYSKAPDSGLPPAGTQITSLDQPDHHYRMPPDYAQNNAIYVDAVNTTATITLANPLNYSSLTFLNATANGAVTVQCTMRYQDNTEEVQTFTAKDWFNGTPFVYNATGRVNLNNRTLNNVNQGNPRLYEAQFVLSNTVSPIVSVEMKWLSGGATSRVAVLAVSATAGALKPVLASPPVPLNVLAGSAANFSATFSGGNEPITYRWQKGEGTTFTDLSDGGPVSGATTVALSLNPTALTDNSQYRLVATNVAGATITPPVRLNVLSLLEDVTSPSDTVTGFGGNSPAAEGPGNAIDNLGQKYLNNGSGPNAAATPFVGPVGLIITPARASVVSGLRIYTANDAVERDPTDFTLEGSNDAGANWEPISNGPLQLPDGRNNANAIDPLTNFLAQALFTNTTSYTSYRITFTNVKAAANANSMQLGEVELLGIKAPAELTISPPVDGIITISTSAAGTLETALNLDGPPGTWSGIGTISPESPYQFVPVQGETRRFFRLAP